MSSRHRRGEASPAYLTTDTRPTGAMLLPAVSPLAFIDEFNAIYQSLGLSIVSHAAGVESVVSASPNAREQQSEHPEGAREFPAT